MRCERCSSEMKQLLVSWYADAAQLLKPYEDCVTTRCGSTCSNAGCSRTCTKHLDHEGGWHSCGTAH